MTTNLVSMAHAMTSANHTQKRVTWSTDANVCRGMMAQIVTTISTTARKNRAQLKERAKMRGRMSTYAHVNRDGVEKTALKIF